MIHNYEWKIDNKCWNDELTITNERIRINAKEKNSSHHSIVMNSKWWNMIGKNDHKCKLKEKLTTVLSRGLNDELWSKIQKRKTQNSPQYCHAA